VELVALTAATATVIEITTEIVTEIVTVIAAATARVAANATMAAGGAEEEGEAAIPNTALK
jgi:hypothetical protein